MAHSFTHDISLPFGINRAIGLESDSITQHEGVTAKGKIDRNRSREHCFAHHHLGITIALTLCDSALVAEPVPISDRQSLAATLRHPGWSWYLSRYYTFVDYLVTHTDRVEVGDAL